MMRLTLLTFLSVLLCPYVLAQAATHPLDPLTREEIANAAQLLKTAPQFPANGRFATIVLQEPPKADVLKFKAGDAVTRQAFAVIYDRAKHKTFEAIADLTAKRIVSFTDVPGAQPGLMLDDVLAFQSIVRGDAQWQAAMRKRGISEFGKVQVEMWSAGNFGFPEEANKRLFRGLSYYRGEAKNPYGHPIEGVIAVVDMNARKVLKLIDTSEATGVVPVPDGNDEADEKAVGTLRAAPQPLQITQPNGVSFTVNGNEIRWQKWRFRYALHPREGVVLYTVGYEDGGKLRSILYRAGMSEMVVPYGDPSAGWFIRNAFDEGEYGIGRLAVPLDEKTDLPPNATTFNALLANEGGGALELKRVIGLYERDGGVAWKHVDYMSNVNESRRARQLVLTFFATVGNYDYGFNWVFSQDGSLELEAHLTGVMATKGVAAKTQTTHSPYGHLVAPGVEGVHHQHFFNFRLDFDVDGQANSVVEQNTEALPANAQTNPQHNAFAMHETTFKREADAQRSINLATARRWRVINPNVKNALGQPTSYQLVTGENSVSYSGVQSAVRQRAGFLNAHVWTTPFATNEQYASGYFINQNGWQNDWQKAGGDGLSKWTKQNRAIENTDVVLWYTFGVTHLPRPEDWPIMPVHKTGFKLVPV